MKTQFSPDVMALNQDVLGGEEPVDVRTELGGYRSKLEFSASKSWVAINFQWFKYEPFSLKYPGGTYTPDFFGPWVPSGELVAAEIKGWNQNLRADRLKFKGAAEEHSNWLQFVWVTYHKGRWVEEWYKPKWLMNR